MNLLYSSLAEGEWLSFSVPLDSHIDPPDPFMMLAIGRKKGSV